MKRKILVAGLGLIGGSLAKAIKKSKDNYIIGYDVSEETLQFALNEQIIDELCTDLEAGVKEAEVVFLAAPISETIKLLKQLDEMKLTKEILVTDVSSVKGSILEVANELKNNKITFVG